MLQKRFVLAAFFIFTMMAAIFLNAAEPSSTPSAEKTEATETSQASKTPKDSQPKFTPPTSIEKAGEPVFPLSIEDPLKTHEHFVVEFFRMLATLAFILVLLFLFLWFAKRLMNARLQQVNEQSPIKILETRQLSAKTLLYLIEVEGEVILIAESHSGVTHLKDLSK